MATYQQCYMWILMFLPVLANIIVRRVSGCHPSSKELHLCLNIYLERDFPLIETIVKGQGRFGRGRVILEGPDLADICRHVGSLRECYGNLSPECDTLWQYDRYMRLMNVLNATHDYLCLNNTNNVRAGTHTEPPHLMQHVDVVSALRSLVQQNNLLLTSGCLIRAQTHISDCTGFDWAMSWRKVLRMQVSPQDHCEQLESYLRCLKTRLKDVQCGSDTSDIYERLINVWLKHWCGKNLAPDDERRYFYLHHV